MSYRNGGSDRRKPWGANPAPRNKSSRLSLLPIDHGESFGGVRGRQHSGHRKKPTGQRRTLLHWIVHQAVQQNRDEAKSPYGTPSEAGQQSGENQHRGE